MSCYIYLADCGDIYTKIGVANCVDKRISSIQSSCPYSIVVRRTIEFKDKKEAMYVEKKIHNHLKNMGLHHKSEWFIGVTDKIVDGVVSSIECKMKRTAWPDILALPENNINAPTLRKSAKDMELMTIEEINNDLQDRRLSVVADSTGLSYQTVYNIRRGTHGDIAYSTAKALSDYLKGAANGRSN